MVDALLILFLFFVFRSGASVCFCFRIGTSVWFIFMFFIFNMLARRASEMILAEIFKFLYCSRIKININTF